MQQVIEDIEAVEFTERQSHNAINTTFRVTPLETSLGRINLDELLEESLASRQPFWMRFSRYSDAIISAYQEHE